MAHLQREEWKKMLDGTHMPGDCVLRLKIDMKHKNTTMRDPVIFRIDLHTHYKFKEKYLLSLLKNSSFTIIKTYPPFFY